MAEWSLQDAKNMFSAVVNAALAGELQRVTRRGQPAVVVLATEEYERLCRLEKAGGSCYVRSGRVLKGLLAGVLAIGFRECAWWTIHELRWWAAGSRLGSRCLQRLKPHTRGQG